MRVFKNKHCHTRGYHLNKPSQIAQKLIQFNIAPIHNNNIRAFPQSQYNMRAILPLQFSAFSNIVIFLYNKGLACNIFKRK